MENAIVHTESLPVSRAEFDSQVATAHQYPRPAIPEIIEEVRAMACISGAVAQSCIYFRPVGRKDGIMGFTDGPSVRLTEIIASAWCNLITGYEIVEVKQPAGRGSPGFVRVKGGCWDTQKNRKEQVEVQRTLYNEKMLDITVAAAGSIAVRNAILKVIPRAYVDGVIDSIKAKVVSDLTNTTEPDLKKAWGMAKRAFAKYGVDEGAMCKVLSIESPDAVDPEGIVKLLGLSNAIKDKLVTVAEVFGEESTRTRPQTSAPKAKSEKAPEKPQKGDKEKGDPKGDDGQEQEAKASDGGEEYPFADFQREVLKKAEQAGVNTAEITAQLTSFGYGSLREVPADKRKDIIEVFRDLAK